ncbi:MAG TPA: chromate transporter [Myxococcaceae bacterium]|nr:chromate transporter [Myxococcaceae bacterium]
MTDAPAPARPRPTLLELTSSALALGAIGFGGGISVLAAIRSMAVARKGWLTEREFTNTATVAQLLPGGAASNALACIGLRFHGVRGALAAYAAFVAPGAAAVLTLAWVYVRFGAVPHADAFLAGLNAAVVGIVVAITQRMLKTGVSRMWQMAVATMALVLSLVGGAGSLEVVCLGIGAGLIWDLGVERARLLRFRRRRFRPAPPVGLPDEGGRLPRGSAPRVEPEPDRGAGGGALGWAMPWSWSGLGAAAAGLLPLAMVFFRVGLGAYGGGFAVIPALHAEVVVPGWITERQFADAVAVGKLTPGPVLLMATFIGYLRQGVPGALVATVAILGAPFALVVTLATWLNRMRSRRWMRAALRGLTPSVVGLMAAAALTLGRTMHTAVGISIAAAVALTLIRFERANPVVLLAIAGVARLVVRSATGI